MLVVEIQIRRISDAEGIECCSVNIDISFLMIRKRSTPSGSLFVADDFTTEMQSLRD